MFAYSIIPAIVRGMSYFGLDKDSMFIALLILGMLTSYLLLRPVTRLLLRWRAETLVNYLLSSLVIVVLLLVWLYLENQVQQFREALLYMAGFGVVLMVVRIIGRIWRKV